MEQFERIVIEQTNEIKQIKEIKNRIMRSHRRRRRHIERNDNVIEYPNDIFKIISYFLKLCDRDNNDNSDGDSYTYNH